MKQEQIDRIMTAVRAYGIAFDDGWRRKSLELEIQRLLSQAEPAVERDSGERPWAVVEVMGHVQYVGRIGLDASDLIRVDVPEHTWTTVQRSNYNSVARTVDVTETTHSRPAFTKILGRDAIYAITPCTEEEVRKRQQWCDDPLGIYEPVSVVGEPKTVPWPRTEKPTANEDVDDPFNPITKEDR